MPSLILSEIPLEQLLDQLKQVVRLELGNTAPGTPAISKPVTTKELCEFLDVTEPTVKRWRDKGVIPFMQIGSAVRFNLNDVLKALEVKNK